MTMVMRETFYRRQEPTWMVPLREPGPYLAEGPYPRYPKVSPYLDEEPYLSPYASVSPFPEPPPSRPPRSSSSIPAFGHYVDSPYFESFAPPPRSSSSIPAYGYPDVSFHDSPPALARSSSSIPAYSNLREPRESRPKQHKVAPEIELRVPMLSSRCEAKVKETLRKLDGVKEVITDRHNSKVTVSGKVDPQVVLQKVQKTKKKADFWTKQIYSQAFIDFIQSKTGRGQPEEEVTSSYHQHVSLDLEGESHHAYEESEHLSSYEEYPGSYPERDAHGSHDRIERTPSHTPFQTERGFYTYGHSSDISPYGMSSSHRHLEESYGDRDARASYASHGAAYYDHYEPSYGAQERVPFYERESRSAYEDFSTSYAEPTSYRPSQSYGPSGISNPGYMKRIISDY